MVEATYRHQEEEEAKVSASAEATDAACPSKGDTKAEATTMQEEAVEMEEPAKEAWKTPTLTASATPLKIPTKMPVVMLAKT